MMASAAYRLGARLDRTSRRSGKGGGEDSGLLLYRVQKTLQEAGRLIRSNLSFGLLMLALGICVVLVWLLVPLL